MTAPATDRVRVIPPGQTYLGMQGFTYGAGASLETVGAQHVCMNVLPMPDGARAKVHYHRGIELRQEDDPFLVATRGMDDEPRAGRPALVARRVRHVRRNEYLIAGANRGAAFELLPVVDGALALEQVGDGFDAAMVMNLRPRAVRHGQDVHADVLRADGFP